VILGFAAFGERSSALDAVVGIAQDAPQELLQLNGTAQW
jgi:hypothetical protein